MFSKAKKLYGILKWNAREKVRRVSNVWRNIRSRPKPFGLSWTEYFLIQRQKFLYQTLVFPKGTVIRRANSENNVDSREKWELLGLPKNLSGYTMMDIGCAEGFFVIQSVLAGARRGIGCDLLIKRLRIARAVARAWNIEDRTMFHQLPLQEIPLDWASDFTICLSVLHHLHRGSHDTWAIITQPGSYQTEFDNMLDAVEKVAALTQKQTFFEYAFEYQGRKPPGVDYKKLADLWVEEGLYRQVNFIGLSLESQSKDRAIYHAYK